ncbi:MAG: hypothetical protein HYX25_09305 [Candidatus Solibacter usitatus]|nr:hypothetical protein [Candidatus Solibacter usitatus]
MATTEQAIKPFTLTELKGKADPDWCPGCGDFGVLAAMQKAIVDLQIQPHNAVTISGIGCSSNLPGYISTYGMHTLHGRALAVATGVKLANHELTVFVTGGDGDGFGIGGNHFMHTMRRNVDLVYLAMDNQIYGLTTGQVSPTSRIGMKKLEEDSTYDSTNLHQAFERAQLWGEEIPIGKFFQRNDLPSLHQAEPVLDQGGPLALRKLGVPPEVAAEFIKELM